MTSSRCTALLSQWIEKEGAWHDSCPSEAGTVRFAYSTAKLIWIQLSKNRGRAGAAGEMTPHQWGGPPGTTSLLDELLKPGRRPQERGLLLPSGALTWAHSHCRGDPHVTLPFVWRRRNLIYILFLYLSIILFKHLTTKLYAIYRIANQLSALQTQRSSAYTGWVWLHKRACSPGNQCISSRLTR